MIILQVVAGRGHETYQLIGNKKKYIDDREECKEALQYVDQLQRAGMDKRVPMVVSEDWHIAAVSGVFS